MVYIGIDPGQTGGIAHINARGDVLSAVKMPDLQLEHELLAAIINLVEPGHVYAMVERAQSFPGMGAKGAFNYGAGYGRILMALTALRIPFQTVHPLTWQSQMNLRTGGDKNVSKRNAAHLFPHVTNITHAIADALLLAEYARRVREGLGARPVAAAARTVNKAAK